MASQETFAHFWHTRITPPYWNTFTLSQLGGNVGRKAKGQRSRGQIIPRGDGKYLVRVYTGLNAKGKRSYDSATVEGTISQAQQKRTAMLNDLDTEQFIAPAKITLKDHIEMWLTNSAPMRVSVGTLVGYRSMLSRICDEIGHVKLQKVTPQMIQTMYAGMAADDLSPRTIELAHTLLKMCLEQAVEWRMISTNPTKGAERPVEEELTDEAKAEMAFTNEEADLFLETAQKDPLYAMWLAFITSGLRPQEMFALKWDDIQDRTVRVQRNGQWVETPTTVIKVQRAMKHVGKGVYVVGVPKTKKSRRTVSLPSSLVAALTVHRRAQAETILASGPDFERNGFVFPNAVGRPLDVNNVRARFHALCEVAKVKKLKLYGLRHTHATLLLAAGVHLKVVSERLGHSSIMLTADVYSHVLPEVEHETALTIDTLLCNNRKAM